MVCSAKGCQAPAQFAVEWNNPKIHTPERIKTWLACAEHVESLSAFLAKRGFYRHTRDVAEIVSDQGPESSQSSPESR